MALTLCANLDAVQAITTSLFVQLQDQHIPPFSFHLGRWKVSASIFQSPLISTKHACNPKSLPALFFLYVSVNGRWSCLSVGFTPCHKKRNDQAITSIRSSQVCSEKLEWGIENKGILRFLNSPPKPGKLMLNTSQLSSLSQLWGTPSQCKPKPSMSWIPLKALQRTRCSRIRGPSQPLLVTLQDHPIAESLPRLHGAIALQHFAIPPFL